MSLTAGKTFTGQPAYIVLDATGKVVTSHNLTLSGTPSNAPDALLQAINMAYNPLREIPLSNGGVLIVMHLV